MRDMTAYAPQAALGRTWELVRRANSYIEESKPWVLARGESAKLAQVLFDVVESIRQIAVLAWPVMPSKCEEILSRFGVVLAPGDEPLEKVLAWGHGWPETIVVKGGAPVFPKYSDADLASKFDIVAPPPGAAEQAGGPVSAAAKGARMLSFQEFQSIDLRLAKVLEASAVEGAKKLLKLRVDLGGGDVRQIVAGVAAAYRPEDLVGKTIVVVANLEPAKIRGIESQGMLLAAVGESTLALLVPDKELPAGTKVS
jgi:methionyl-tRNA synthetase